MAGLDAKHRHILDQMKREISEKNKLASREANKVRSLRRARKFLSLLLCQTTRSHSTSSCFVIHKCADVKRREEDIDDPKPKTLNTCRT
jgi:hypothetical protein